MLIVEVLVNKLKLPIAKTISTYQNAFTHEEKLWMLLQWLMGAWTVGLTQVV